MQLLEIGGLASALIAVITLISKLIGLISAIQKLIYRIDYMQEEIQRQKQEGINFDQQIHLHSQQISTLDHVLSVIRTDVLEIKENVKELQTYALG